MTRNWYAVYTRPLKERKVASILSKKGIENYCPVIAVEPKLTSKKQLLLPLFNSFVFVCVAEKEIASLLAVPGIINVVFWRSKPAVISHREIDIVKKLTNNYSNIRLEKSFVDINATVTILDEPLIAYNENTVSVKYKSIKVNLPSLGYTMIAERIKQKEKTDDYQQPGLIASFPRRINAFFFN
jgi:transcription antitermination factor NusG